MQLCNICESSTRANFATHVYSHSSHNSFGQKFEKVENEENVNFVISQNSFKCEFNTPHIVKFDSGLILFSLFLFISVDFYDKKIFLCFFDNFVEKSG